MVPAIKMFPHLNIVGEDKQVKCLGVPHLWGQTGLPGKQWTPGDFGEGSTCFMAAEISPAAEFLPVFRGQYLSDGNKQAFTVTNYSFIW